MTNYSPIEPTSGRPESRLYENIKSICLTWTAVILTVLIILGFIVLFISILEWTVKNRPFTECLLNVLKGVWRLFSNQSF
jgi:uncharacterized protein YggT (Ycf19 family)